MPITLSVFKLMEFHILTCACHTHTQTDMHRHTDIHSLSVGRAAVLDRTFPAAGPQVRNSQPPNLRLCGCHTASSGGYWRRFYSDSEATAQCELFLTAPNRNILTNLVTKTLSDLSSSSQTVFTILGTKNIHADPNICFVCHDDHHHRHDVLTTTTNSISSQL